MEEVKGILPKIRETGVEVEGILSGANSAMEKAIRVISVERSYDPREFTLFTFSGAGGFPDKAAFEKSPISSAQPSDESWVEEKEVVFDSRPVKTKIYQRERLVSENRIQGPAILVEYSDTIVVPLFAEVWVDSYGNLMMEIR